MNISTVNKQIHMMGDSDRGYLLELMVTKLLYAKSNGWQIVGLSATIPNADSLRQWLGNREEQYIVISK